MGYSIVLDRKFIRVSSKKASGIIPLTLTAESNVYESFSGRRARDWGLMVPRSISDGNVWYNEQKLMEAVKAIQSPDVVYMKGKWLGNTDTDDSFARFMQNGVDGACTFDEFINKYRTAEGGKVILTCSMEYSTSYGEHSFSESVDTQDKFDAMVERIADILDEPSLELIKQRVVLNTQEPLKLNKGNKAAPKSVSASERPTYYVLKGRLGYMYRLVGAGYKYTYSPSTARAFKTRGAAESWLKENSWRIGGEKNNWVVVEAYRYPLLQEFMGDEYNKKVKALQNLGVQPKVIDRLLGDAQYLLQKYEDNVSLAFAKPENLAKFRCWQFSKGVYTVEAFAEFAKKFV